MPPLLVDFTGGKRQYNPAPGAGGSGIVDSSAMDLLILMPDGRLVVRNSRADVDAVIDNGTPDGTTRQARVEHWRKRNREVQTGGGTPGEGAGGGAPSILPGR
jgi:hypothetical protein